MAGRGGRSRRVSFLLVRRLQRRGRESDARSRASLLFIWIAIALHTPTSSLWPRKDLGDYEWQSHMPSRWM